MGTSSGLAEQFRYPSILKGLDNLLSSLAQQCVLVCKEARLSQLKYSGAQRQTET